MRRYMFAWMIVVYIEMSLNMPSYVQNMIAQDGKLTNGQKNSKKFPRKVLHYFTIIPRLNMMLGIDEMSTQLRCHSSNKSLYGKIMHPIDHWVGKRLIKGGLICIRSLK